VRGFARAVPEVSKIELFVDDQFQHRVTTDIPLIDVVLPIRTGPASRASVRDSRPAFWRPLAMVRTSLGQDLHADNKIFELGRRTITSTTPSTSHRRLRRHRDLKGIYDANGSFPSGLAADTDGIARVDVKVDEANVQSAIYGDGVPTSPTPCRLPDALFSGFVANIAPPAFRTASTSSPSWPPTVSVCRARSAAAPFRFQQRQQPQALRLPRRAETRCGSLRNAMRRRADRVAADQSAVAHHSHPWLALDLSTREDVGGVAYVEFLIDGKKWVSTDGLRLQPHLQRAHEL